MISQTILRECFTDPQERVVTFSAVSAALAWTPALGPLLGGQLVSSFGMSYVFFFLTILGLGIFLCSKKELREVRREDTQKVRFWNVVYRMITDLQIYLNTLLVAGYNVVIFFIYAETPFVFMNTFGWSARSYSFIGIGMAIGSMIGARLNKVFAYKGWSGMGRIRFGLVWMIFSSGLYMLPTLLGFEENTYLKMAWLLVALCLIFIGIVISLPNVFGESLNAYQDCLGTAGALFGLLYYLVISTLLGLISGFSSKSLLFIGQMVSVMAITMLILTNFVRYKKIS